MSTTTSRLATRRQRRPRPRRGALGWWLDDVDRWCEGRLWLPRLALVLFFAWTWIRHLRDPLHQSIFKGLNLGIHELGHYVFAVFGDIPEVLGGSLLQCLAPVLAMVMFARQRDWFAIAFAFGWLATNLFDVAVYVGDAVAQRLPLVSPGGGHPIHDWNYILGHFGWLRHTETLAALHALAGHLAMAACLVGGTWLVGKMVVTRRRDPSRRKSLSARAGVPLE